MNGRLDLISDWPALAEQAGYSVEQMARLCGVSVRQLERFFKRTKQETPKHWIHRVRLQRALTLLQKGLKVKEAAADLGYKSPATFSHIFTKTFGFPPSQGVQYQTQQSTTP